MMILLDSIITTIVFSTNTKTIQDGILYIESISRNHDSQDEIQENSGVIQEN